jgi:hypothetical protein
MQSSQPVMNVIRHHGSILTMAGVLLSIVVIAIFKCAHRIGRSKRLSANKDLTEQQAIEIYKQKLEFMKSIRAESRRTRSARIKSKCAELGVCYRVSPRTIWDV